jgi:hypothetical protein
VSGQGRTVALIVAAALAGVAGPNGIVARATSPASGGFDLPDPTTGLSELASYHASLTVTFTGTRDGQPDSWTLTRLLTVGRDPSVRQLDEEQTGAAPHRWFRADVGVFRYERADEGPCATTVLDAPDAPPPGAVPSDAAEPAGLLSGFLGAQEVAAEEIDGIATIHYTFDDRALGSLDPASSIGDAWIATDGGYVVRYTLTTEGGAAWLGPGAQGVSTFDYALTSVGQPVTVVVPPDCPIGPVDAALPPDAHDVVTEPGRLTYRTASVPADVVAFHQARLSGAGWQPDGSVLVGIDGRIASFVRAAEELTVIANIGPGGSEVTIIVARTL